MTEWLYHHHQNSEFLEYFCLSFQLLLFHRSIQVWASLQPYSFLNTSHSSCLPSLSLCFLFLDTHNTLCNGEGNGNPLQCSCLENPRDREARWAAAYGVAQSRTRLKWLSSSSNTLCIPLLWHSSCCTKNWFLMFCLWIVDFLRARAGSCSSLNL